MFAAYEKERQGVETEVDPHGHGFVTWKPLWSGQVPPPRDAYVVDIYVVPEHRKNGVASRLNAVVAEKAKAIGATRLIGTIDSRNLTRTPTMKAMLANGYEFDRVDGFMLVFSKEIP